jgi:hypothetical protein
MNLHPAQALTYLHDCGIEMARRTYFRHKKKVESLKWQRLIHAANLFTEQHLKRLDKLELIESLMWRHYNEEPNPTKKVKILQSIVSMQPYISNYYGATTFVLAKRLKSDVIEGKSEPEPQPPIFSLSHDEQDELRRMTRLQRFDSDGLIK